MPYRRALKQSGEADVKQQVQLKYTYMACMLLAALTLSISASFVILNTRNDIVGSFVEYFHLPLLPITKANSNILVRNHQSSVSIQKILLLEYACYLSTLVMVLTSSVVGAVLFIKARIEPMRATLFMLIPPILSYFPPLSAAVMDNTSMFGISPNSSPERVYMTITVVLNLAGFMLAWACLITVQYLSQAMERKND